MLLLCVAHSSIATEEETSQCTDSWYAQVENKITTSDQHAHGPDVGGNEWRSVVEFRLGIRGNEQNPPLDSEAWCTFIDKNYINSK